MSTFTPFQQHILDTLTRFESELDQKKLNVIMQSVTTQAHLDRLVDNLEVSLRAELVRQVRYSLSRVARASDCKTVMWGWAVASLDDSSTMPVTARARALSQMLAMRLQDAALEAIEHDQLGFVRDLHLKPIEVQGSYRLEASGPTWTGQSRVPLCFLRPSAMLFNDFWIALCQQIIAEKNASANQRVYGSRSDVYGTLQLWVFDGSAEDWVSLLLQLLTYPPQDDTPATRMLILGEPPASPVQKD